jgi:type II secretion system protein G
VQILQYINFNERGELMKKDKHLKQKEKAFTLIELLVVIAVIGILIAVILPNLIGMRERARDSKRKNDLAQLKTALRMYFNDYNSYPGATDGQKICCSAPATCDPCINNVFGVGTQIYSKDLLTEYTYTTRDGGQGFLLGTILENASDKDIATGIARCQVSSPADNTFYICED